VLAGASAGASYLLVVLVYHSYLAVTNQTTWEHWSPHRISYLRHHPERAPFSRGFAQNLLDFFHNRG
jgi:palmitoyltransferase